MKVNKSSWRFALATAGGMFVMATGVHVVNQPGELVDYVAGGVQEILPEQQDEAPTVSAAE